MSSICKNVYRSSTNEVIRNGKPKEYEEREEGIQAREVVRSKYSTSISKEKRMPKQRILSSLWNGIYGPTQGL